jgi:hypothetical protein
MRYALLIAGLALLASGACLRAKTVLDHSGGRAKATIAADLERDSAWRGRPLEEREALVNALAEDDYDLGIWWSNAFFACGAVNVVIFFWATSRRRRAARLPRQTGTHKQKQLPSARGDLPYKADFPCKAPGRVH